MSNLQGHFDVAERNDQAVALHEEQCLLGIEAQLAALQVSKSFPVTAMSCKMIMKIAMSVFSQLRLTQI